MRLVLALVSSMAALLGAAAPARSHEDDLHLGGMSTGIPPVVAWIGGVGIGVVFILLLLGWVSSRRSGRRMGQGGAVGAEPGRSEKHDAQ